MPLNKDEFLSWIAQPLREKVVEIDGKELRLREMSEAQRADYELMLQDKKGKPDYTKARRAMIAIMLIDSDGNRIVQHESELMSMPGGLAGVLFDECLTLNRYDKKEIEDLIKNSDGADG
jgi:hypothetical protein